MRIDAKGLVSRSGTAYALALSLCAAVFGFARGDFCDGRRVGCTMITCGSEQLMAALELHRTQVPFRNRVGFTDALSWLIAQGVSPEVGYASLQYALLCVFFVVARRYGAVLLGADSKAGLVLPVALALSYPVLFMDYFPMYTWDDVALYIGVLIGLSFAARQQAWFAIVCLALSAFIRETALLFVPFVAVHSNAAWAKRALLLSVPVIPYVLWVSSRGSYDLREVVAAHLEYNFGSSARAIDSATHAWLSVGPAGFIAVAVARPSTLAVRGPSERFLSLGCVMVLPALLAVNALLGRVREPRISFPSAFITVPMMLLGLRAARSSERVLQACRTAAYAWVIGSASLLALTITQQIGPFLARGAGTASSTARLIYMALVALSVCALDHWYLTSKRLAGNARLRPTPADQV